MKGSIYIHPTAQVHESSKIGPGSTIWNDAQIREGVVLGEGCIVGKGAYIDQSVQIGSHVKIQNGVSVYQGVTLEDGVFCGPHSTFTNDMYPRAINPDGTPRGADDWKLVPTLIRRGASIGANATIRCGVTVGEWAMIGAGSVVTRDIPPHALVLGNPARMRGYVCCCGVSLNVSSDETQSVSNNGNATFTCEACGTDINIGDFSLERNNSTN